MRLAKPLSAMIASLLVSHAFADAIGDLQKSFAAPPDDARIMVRWWWFGPAVTKEGIDRELSAMKAGDIGGVELQNTYPLSVDQPNANPPIKNLRWLSPEHLALIGHAAEKASELGLRFDLTLGSGWPYGGPMFDQATEGAKQLEVITAWVTSGQKTVQLVQQNSSPEVRALPPAFAAFAGGGGRRDVLRGGGAPDRGPPPGLGEYKQVPLVNGVAQLPDNFTGDSVLFFIAKPAGLTQVKRPALGAEGPIIDHLSAKVVSKFIEQVGEPMLKACGDHPPYAIFCDSLETQGENWTPDFLAEFKKRRGYDLTPYLPALAGISIDKAEAVRHDYGQTLTEVFNDNFNAKFTALAKKYHTRFRIQGYGYPPAGLQSFAYVDLPEGEGGGNGLWRTFRTTRYASSAAHLMNVPVASSETFTWLHQTPFRATPLDMKGEVDTHFLEGINQIVCHGWPYTPDGVRDPGWNFYAAGVFDDKNPWYVAMPEIAGYMQRVSFMMRQGTPANSVALYLNDSDVWAGADALYSSMNAAFTSQAGALDAILDAGYGVDAFDDGMLALKGKVEGRRLAFGDTKYSAVVLNHATHMPLATARALKSVGTVVSVGPPPSIVPGLNATPQEQAELAEIMRSMFTPSVNQHSYVIDDLKSVGGVLGTLFAMRPDIELNPPNPDVGFVHRHTDFAEVYFIANTGTKKAEAQATFDAMQMNAEQWNPLDGSVRPVAVLPEPVGRGRTGPPWVRVNLALEPLESTIIVLTKRELPASPATHRASIEAMNLSDGWMLGIGGQTVPMAKLVSWTELPEMVNFSGVARYERKVTLDASYLRDSMMLSLGAATVLPPAPAVRGQNGYAAPIDSPVKDAAVVYVNGQRAGAVWCPPFQIDVGKFLKVGENTIRIDVANTAVNELAKTGFPVYNEASLRQAFGNRFQTQGNIGQPLPSGLAGPIRLLPVP